VSAVPNFRIEDEARRRIDAAMQERDDVEQQARLPLVAVDIHDIAKMTFRPRQSLLGPWLCSQDLTMVHAARGIGKTHFALGVAFAVATGGTFLKWGAPGPRKVLYLDGELPGVVMQGRLLIHLGEVEPEPGMLRVFTPDLPEMEGRPLPDLATQAGQAEIDAMVEDDTALVVVDNLSAWARTGAENEAEAWLPIADWALRLRRRGVALLLVHHDGKNGGQRGTSKKEDLLDAVIQLSRPADYEPSQGSRFVVKFTKARHLVGEQGDSIEAFLEGNDTSVSWQWTPVEAATFGRVVELANAGLKPGEIADELSINKSTVSRHLRRARDEGRFKGS